VLAALTVVGTSAMLPVLQNSVATSQGFNIQSVQTQRASLESDILILESDVARLSSLTRVQRRAQQLGLGPSSNPVYVTVDVPGPEPAKIPAEYLPRPIPLRAEPEAWWRSLLGWLPSPH
jgi:hypothetical protein